MSKRIISIVTLIAFMLVGGLGFIPVKNANVKALAQDARITNGRVIDHEVIVGPDGEPIHAYVCVGDGICGH